MPNLAQPPPRSRFYNLEPVGVGTPYVECLTGYAARLAGEHSSTVYYLFSREVAPLLGKPGTVSLRVSFASFNKAANGLGVIAADLVNVFKQLALREDLRFTTMLPWAGALSTKNLIRGARAWCPDCYEECAIGGTEVYEQLIWSVQCVATCPRHMRRLEHTCPYCGRGQLALSHRIRPGFCGRCECWLGHPRGGPLRIKALQSIETSEEELRVAEEVGKLLAAAPTLPSTGATVDFTKNLLGYIPKMFMGRGIPSNTTLPAGKQTVRCWLAGVQRPSLLLLLKTCFALNISPLDLLRGNCAGGRGTEAGKDEHGGHQERAAPRYESHTGPLVNWIDPTSVALVERRLLISLKCHPPSSLTKLAKELNCTRATLRKKFPRLATLIAERANNYYRPSANAERVRQVLIRALEEDPPPSLADVSRRFHGGASTTTLHKKFPEESRRIVERYSAHSKRRLDGGIIEKRLEEALERPTAPSMPEVSRELGVPRAKLYLKFPELCGAISKRFVMNRREEIGRNRRKAEAEIRDICESAVRDGIYPTAALVRTRLSVPCQSEAFSKIRREVLAQMGCHES